MASITDLTKNLPEIVDFNEFGKIKDTILMICPQMFDSCLNEVQKLINKIESLANIVINETPKEPEIEGESESVKSLKLSLLRFKYNIIVFRTVYLRLINDFALYLECELLLNQEKLIKNTTCQLERESDVFLYNKPLEDSIWCFKSDLRSLINYSYTFQNSERELIPGINRLRIIISISQIKVVTNRLGYLNLAN